MNEATELARLLEPMLWQAALVFLRVGAIAAVLPGFGNEAVPMRIRLALALAFTAIVAPAAPIETDAEPALGPFLRFLTTETLTGLALGLGLRLMVLALQTAGAIAANATSLSQLLGGAQAEPIPAIGQVLTIGGLALAMMAGLHVRLAEFMILSYGLLPAGQFPDAAAFAAWGTGRVARAFWLAFTLAAPFVILSMLYNLALGAINKAMPQLMVAFVGAPVITLGGLALFAVAAPLMLSVWLDALHLFLETPMGSD
ncbi:type III secretion protein [Rhodosalinus halophilus]|uniref:Type III secretion protein n=1 Tax=Rhodosalinus halophilus TaxID=2259333 RepID=A0A365U7M6_9RHOB|nr:flagellar biosynthetic protein FliR [Rhodosalinus halophilus]RBI84632.1 type III secretion protein [Rhodosalinus halophilus]